MGQRKGPGYDSRRGEFISAILKTGCAAHARCHSSFFLSLPCLPRLPERLFQNGRNEFPSSRVVTWRIPLSGIDAVPRLQVATNANSVPFFSSDAFCTPIYLFVNFHGNGSDVQTGDIILTAIGSRDRMLAHCPVFAAP